MFAFIILIDTNDLCIIFSTSRAVRSDPKSQSWEVVVAVEIEVVSLISCINICAKGTVPLLSSVSVEL